MDEDDRLILLLLSIRQDANIQQGWLFSVPLTDAGDLYGVVAA